MGVDTGGAEVVDVVVVVVGAAVVAGGDEVVGAAVVAGGDEVVGAAVVKAVVDEAAVVKAVVDGIVATDSIGFPSPQPVTAKRANAMRTPNRIEPVSQPRRTPVIPNRIPSS